jgi:hypothetical protein
MFHYWFLIGVHMFRILSIDVTHILSCIVHTDLHMMRLVPETCYTGFCNMEKLEN